MASDSDPRAPAVARLVSEELSVAVDLPSGWELDLDTTSERLTAVGSDTPQCVGALCPAISVRRLALAGTGPDFDRLAFDLLARESLEAMHGSYEHFELRWSQGARDGLALRRYCFVLAEVDQVVEQLQGLIEAPNDAAVYVVDCSAPHATFATLEPTFQRVIRSLEPLGPDYVVPGDIAERSRPVEP